MALRKNRPRGCLGDSAVVTCSPRSAAVQSPVAQTAPHALDASWCLVSGSCPAPERRSRASAQGIALWVPAKLNGVAPSGLHTNVSPTLPLRSAESGQRRVQSGRLMGKRLPKLCSFRLRSLSETLASPTMARRRHGDATQSQSCAKVVVKE